MDDSRTVKTQKGVESGNQKYGEIQRHKNNAFRRHSGISTFNLLPQLGSAREIGSNQASASWTPVTPPATAVAPYRRCGCLLPLPPLLPSWAPAAPATTAASAVDCDRRCCRRSRCRSLPSLALFSAADAAASRHCCRLWLRPHLQPPPPLSLDAPSVTTGRCRRSHFPGGGIVTGSNPWPSSSAPRSRPWTCPPLPSTAPAPSPHVALRCRRWPRLPSPPAAAAADAGCTSRGGAIFAGSYL